MPNNNPRRTRAQHLATFFASYPDFEHDPSSPVSNEFNRLVKSHRWKRGSWQRENAWRGYSEAMGMQFASFYGTSEDDMNAWHALCAALRVDPAPDTINECKEIIKSTHVNLVDFIDTPVTGKPVRIFETEQKLREYTKKTSKFFPKESAKESGVLRYLLREIL